MNASRRKLCLSIAAGVGTAALGGVMNAQGAGRHKPKERVIRIQAKKFSYTPNEIIVKEGESVVLEFTSLDFMHGFSVPDLKIRADLPPGQATRVPLPSVKAGIYDFLCDNFCGSGHEQMSGRIIVRS
jgi:cytochrome c oxidase subunit II